MKVKAYVLVVSAITMMSAGTKDMKSVGVNPGNLAPGIKSLGNLENVNFQNHSEQYTLLNFWAAYDAESRARNVQLANEINKSYFGKIEVMSVSLDENPIIFEETIRIDALDAGTQYHEALGDKSELFRKYKQKEGLGNFLIDRNGVIVAKNITPDKLTELMKMN